MRPSSLIALPLLAAAAGAASGEAAVERHGQAPPPPPPQLFWGFDAGFGDNMVLQQGPAKAAVYGYLDVPAASVRVTVLHNGVALYSVNATLNATQQPFGAGWGVRPCSKADCPPYDMATFTPFAYPLPTWKALLQPMAAGENYTITAVCTGCGNASAPARALTLSNVAFGDVWFCSGQSNMWLPVLHTFDRNDTARNISAGKYANIRVMAGSSANYPYAQWPPAYGDGTVPHASNAWMTAQQAAPAGCMEAQSCPLFSIGATCWYTAQSLANHGVSVPLGLINTALGGQRIEEYMLNTTTAACTDLSGSDTPWWNAQLYGTYINWFVDMTVKGWWWYQGACVRAPVGGGGGG
jgi:hypothetical protein